MALIEELLPWYSQPPGGHPVGHGGPIAAVIPAGGALTTSAAGAAFAQPLGVSNGDGAIVAPGLFGLAARGVSSSTNTFRLHSAANATDTVWELPRKQVTVLVYFVRTGAGGGNRPIFGNSSPTTSPYTAWGLMDPSGAGAALRFECSPGGVYRSVTGSVSMTLGAPTVGIGVYDGAAMRLYQNGSLIGSLSTTGDITYPNDSARGPAILNFWNFTASPRTFAGDVFLAALWDRALSTDEVTGVSANPWSIFDDQRIWVPVSSGAPILPTLSLPTYVPGSLTSAGFRPRVTAS